MKVSQSKTPIHTAGWRAAVSLTHPWGRASPLGTSSWPYRLATSCSAPLLQRMAARCRRAELWLLAPAEVPRHASQLRRQARVAGARACCGPACAAASGAPACCVRAPRLAAHGLRRDAAAAHGLWRLELRAEAPCAPWRVRRDASQPSPLPPRRLPRRLRRRPAAPCRCLPHAGPATSVPPARRWLLLVAASPALACSESPLTTMTCELHGIGSSAGRLAWLDCCACKLLVPTLASKGADSKPPHVKKDSAGTVCPGPANDSEFVIRACSLCVACPLLKRVTACATKLSSAPRPSVVCPNLKPGPWTQEAHDVTSQPCGAT